jgi:hypothetical protein
MAQREPLSSLSEVALKQPQGQRRRLTAAAGAMRPLDIKVIHPVGKEGPGGVTRPD